MIKEGLLKERNMGQKNKINVQKDKLKTLFIKLVETNIALIEFQLTLTSKKEEINGLKKVIKRSNRAIEIIKGIDHIEILSSLYNAYMNKKEPYFVSFVCTIDRKIINKWDKTEKGFKEFLEQEQEAIEKTEQEEKEKKETLDVIKKAKEEGKKIELLYKDGKIKPVVVNEKVDC